MIINKDIGENLFEIWALMQLEPVRNKIVSLMPQDQDGLIDRLDRKAFQFAREWARVQALKLSPSAPWLPLSKRPDYYSGYHVRGSYVFFDSLYKAGLLRRKWGCA